MLAMCVDVLVYYSRNITMTLFTVPLFVLVAILSFIFAHGLYSHCMVGLTFLRFM